MTHPAAVSKTACSYHPDEALLTTEELSEDTAFGPAHAQQRWVPFSTNMTRDTDSKADANDELQWGNGFTRLLSNITI